MTVTNASLTSGSIKATLKSKVVSCPAPEWAKKGRLEGKKSQFLEKKKIPQFSQYILVNEKLKTEEKNIPTSILDPFFSTWWTGNYLSFKGGLMTLI